MTKTVTTTAAATKRAKCLDCGMSRVVNAEGYCVKECAAKHVKPAKGKGKGRVNPNLRMRGEVTQRRCTQCDTWKNQDHEHFAYAAPSDHWNSWCKPCCVAIAKAKREAAKGA